MLKFKITILFSIFLYSTSAYLTKDPDFYYIETFNSEVDGVVETTHHVDGAPFNSLEQDVDSVWVLDLESSMLDSLKLRPATEAERRDFGKSVGPLIARVKNQGRQLQRPPSKAEHQQSPHVLDTSTKVHNKDYKNQIMAMVNKFIVSAVGIDRDSQMPESTDIFSTPSLALYFQGPYSAVILKYGKTEWKFFFSDPSPLPAWFYEDHRGCLTTGASHILVPEYVEDQFYDTFAQLLKLFFRVDI